MGPDGGVPARLSLVTLGVRDVERSAAFYEAWGWRRSSASVDGEVAFLGTAGSVLSLYREAALAEDVGQPVVQGFRGVSLAVNVAGREEVDRAVVAAVTAGAEVVAAAATAPWGGYTALVADPDGHIWELAHNPAWPIGPDGRLELPD